MADKRLAGKRVLMVIAPHEFRDEELLEPKEILTQEGAKVVVASTQAGEAQGMLGAKVEPDIVIDKATMGDYAAIIVVGGMGSPEHLWNHKHLHKLLQEGASDNKVVAGICLSGAVLANAGVLAGKNATVWACPESLEAMEKGKAKYQKQPVVQDGNFITAEGPEAASEFANSIVTAMQKVTSKV